MLKNPCGSRKAGYPPVLSRVICVSVWCARVVSSSTCPFNPTEGRGELNQEYSPSDLTSPQDSAPVRYKVKMRIAMPLVYTMKRSEGAVSLSCYVSACGHIRVCLCVTRGASGWRTRVLASSLEACCLERALKKTAEEKPNNKQRQPAGRPAS